MFRALPEDVQIDDDGKCKSCGSHVDSYSRYGVRGIAIFLFVPGVLALFSKVREWSVEYLPDFSDAPIPMMSLAAIALMFALSLYLSKRYGKPMGQWAMLPVVPLILFLQAAGVRHGSASVANAVERLDAQTVRLERMASNGSLAAMDLRPWSEALITARSALEQDRDHLGSTRIAVYGYAIDAATLDVTGGKEVSDKDALNDMSRTFERIVGKRRTPFELSDFVACYREADRPKVSHRGILRTEAFRTCFDES